MPERPRGFFKMSGLDRSDAPPPETRKGAPLRPWTIPNLIGYVRILLVVLFVYLAFDSDDGRSLAAFWVFGFAGGTDYLDGFVARATGQYSRLGSLMDPLIDRLLIISGVVVCWHFVLVPRWALAALIAREIVMLVVVAYGLSRGLDVKVNMVGRVVVWFVMAGLGFSLISDGWVVRVTLYTGLAGSWAATLLYIRDGARQLRDRPQPTASSG